MLSLQLDVHYLWHLGKRKGLTLLLHQVDDNHDSPEPGDIPRHKDFRLVHVQDQPLDHL